MPLSELPPSIDSIGEIGAQAPMLRVPPPGAISRAWLARFQSVDAPAAEARRARRAEISGLDMAPIVITSGRGSNLFDLDGNRYVDLAAGFGSALVGHNHERIARQLMMQAERLTFGLGDVFPSDAKIALTERLARLFPEAGARVLLGLSGSDAVDAALKTALLATGKPGILAFEGAYHGLATGPLATCGYRSEFRTPFEPHLTPHVQFVPYPTRNEPDSLEKSLSAIRKHCETDTIGAIVVEPILGRGGVIVPPENFLKNLREICDRFHALLIVDEIWTGLGRSGSILYSTSHDVIPDVICLGKGLGGGLPLSACIGRGSVMDAWRSPKQNNDTQKSTFSFSGEAIHTSTYAGNPLACSNAIATLDIVAGSNLAQRAYEQGTWFVSTLQQALDARSHIREVRGVGLMIGIEVEGGATRGLRLIRDCLMKGYIVLAGGAGDVITLTPPLTIARSLLEQFIDDFVELTRADTSLR